MSETKLARQYKIQVPNKKPEGTIQDKRGRDWIQASKIPNDFIQWDIDEDTWYVWFRGSDLECPEEGEIIEFEDMEYSVDSVYHFNRLKRAVITFSS